MLYGLLGRVPGRFAAQRQTTTVLTRLFCAGKAVLPAPKEKIAEMVQADKVVVFMKGSPEQPQCGFSRAVALILARHNVPFKSYNVLEDESVRAGVKLYSDWQTIPQVFVDGKFVGGCDIMLDYHKSGELVKLLKEAGITSALKDAIPPDQQKTESSA